jgi:hypothetical protein
LLISNRHKFIFVHVPKTAGLSMARALEPYADSPPREGVRRLMSHLPLPESEREVAFRLHVSARWARLKLPSAVFDGYCKFAVVRNPYDRAVSLYHFLSQRPDNRNYERVSRLSFKGFLDELASRQKRFRNPTQLGQLADRNGQLLIDHTLRFESLNDDFADLCRTLNLGPNVGLPTRNASAHQPYWEYYGDDYNRLAVADIFAADFKAFGYSLDINLPATSEARRLVA